MSISLSIGIVEDGGLLRMHFITPCAAFQGLAAFQTTHVIFYLETCELRKQFRSVACDVIEAFPSLFEYTFPKPPNVKHRGRKPFRMKMNIGLHIVLPEIEKEFSFFE